MKKLIVVVAILVLSVGCQVTDKDRRLISTGASVGQNNLMKWETLTSDQRREAQFNLVAAMVVLDYTVNGKPVPPQFKVFLDALMKDGQ